MPKIAPRENPRGPHKRAGWQCKSNALHNTISSAPFSLGLGTDISVHLISKIHFRVYSISSIVVLGATDFNYDDILKEFYPEYEPTRTYQISYGLNYKTGFSARYKQLEFMHKSNIFLLKTIDRKSTRLNSSHVRISYAVFCLKKKTLNFDRLAHRFAVAHARLVHAHLEAEVALHALADDF